MRCCGSASQTALVAGPHITVTGTGAPSSPFVISGDTALGVSDNQTFNLTLSGLGDVSSPWVIAVNFASTAKLDHLPDVDASNPVNGEVLGFNAATGKWQNVAATSATPGAINTDTSLTGDGSAGDVLGIAFSVDDYLEDTGGGLTLTDDTANELVRKYGDDTSRGLDPLSPNLNTVSMLDDNPGQQDYWTGSQWLPVTNGVSRVFLGGELLAMSGSYPANAPVAIYVKQVSETTDSVGEFDVLSAADLTGRAGVLFVQFQETGTVPFKAVVQGSVDHIIATAYRVDDGTPYATQAVSGMAFAYVY